MKLHPVQLDFRTPPRSPLGGWLAAFGALVVIATGIAFFLLAQRELELETRRDQLAAESRQLTDAGNAAAVYDPDGEVSRRLTQPWQALLLALEEASDPRIDLIEIRPDPGQQRLRLTAEANTLDDALDYVRRLNQIQIIKQAHLLNYTAMPTQAGPSVLRFIVQAEWPQPAARRRP